MNKQDRLRRLEQRAQPKGEDVLYAVVGPGGQVTVTDKPTPRCENEYHMAVIGADGVARVLLSAGRVKQVKPCAGCGS